MFFNKIPVYILLILSMAFVRTNFTLKHSSITIAEGSSLVLKGNSNVHKFSCSYNISKIKNPIPITYSANGQHLSFQNTTLVLDNISFDCGGSGINKDFQKTLKTEDHPQISLSLKKIEPTENTSIVHATIEIKIANKTHNYTIPLEVKKNKNLYVSGQLDIQLSDYHLKAPKKLFGIITVDDIIEINFQLEIQD